MASGLQGGYGGSEQHSKKANHHAERISATGAKTAFYWTDEKTTGTGRDAKKWRTEISSTNDVGQIAPLTQQRPVTQFIAGREVWVYLD